MADVIILPIIRAERTPDDEHMIQVRLRRSVFQRLMKRANEWNVSVDEAAEFVIEQALAPQKK